MTKSYLKIKPGIIVSAFIEGETHFIDFISKSVKDLAPDLILSPDTDYHFSCNIKRETNSHNLWNISLMQEDKENE